MDSQFLVSWRRLRATPLYREVPHYSQDGSLCYTMLYTSAYERGIKKKASCAALVVIFICLIFLIWVIYL